MITIIIIITHNHARIVEARLSFVLQCDTKPAAQHIKCTKRHLRGACERIGARKGTRGMPRYMGS